MTKEELEKMFYNNINLAYKISNKYVINYKYEIDDIQQIALFGLWKSVLTYDKTKKYKFSTYAYSIISNEINYYLRSVKKRYEDISINTPITDDFVIEDILKDDKNAIDILLDHLTYEELYSYINIIQNPKHKKIYLLYINQNYTQLELAKKFNMSQTNISKIIRNMNKKLFKKYINR